MILTVPIWIEKVNSFFMRYSFFFNMRWFCDQSLPAAALSCMNNWGNQTSCYPTFQLTHWGLIYTAGTSKNNLTLGMCACNLRSMDISLRTRCDWTLQSLVNPWLWQRGWLPPALRQVSHNLEDPKKSTANKIILKYKPLLRSGLFLFSFLATLTG